MITGLSQGDGKANCNFDTTTKLLKYRNSGGFDGGLGWGGEGHECRKYEKLVNHSEVNVSPLVVLMVLKRYYTWRLLLKR